MLRDGLRRNDRAIRPNNNVKRLQENLNRYNFSLKVDGIFGKSTEDAVNATSTNATGRQTREIFSTTEADYLVVSLTALP